MRGIALAFVLGLAVACGVEVSVDNKGCPCTSGYVCDSARNICVRPEALTPAAAAPRTCDPCPCTTSAECTDPTRPFCAPDTKVCVECNPQDDKCGIGTYCNAKFQCTAGCRTSEYCQQISPSSPLCQPERHACVVCLTSDSCGGKTCTPSGTCAETCDAGKPCPQGGQACCGGLCIDVTSDAFNCGACGKACGQVNGATKCAAGTCAVQCANGFAHCSTDPNSGCETSTRSDTANCGSCGHDCNATVQHANGIACASSKCVFTGCAFGFVDADKNPDNGCEAPCGDRDQACCGGNKCNSDLNCRSGMCTKSGGDGQ